MNLELNFITLVSILLAALPAIIWSYIFFSDDRKQYRGLFFKVFLGGTLTVVPILGMQWAYFKIIGKFPDADFVFTLKQMASSTQWIIILYSFVSITEEIVKFYIVRYSDKNHPELITNINQSLKFGILSGLGFAFSENILYFSSIWSNLGSSALVAPLLFRSTFTVCAHVCFTGIFSYYYGISKFSQDFVDLKKWLGKKIAINEYQKIRNYNIAVGLGLAFVLHAAFNSILELGSRNPAFQIGDKSINLYVIAVIILVMLMFLFLQYLLERKTGNLTFILADRHKSTMPVKDREVVLELMGMWFNQGRFQEVEEICERLLKRDPDNNVVKLFKATVQEKLEK